MAQRVISEEAAGNRKKKSALRELSRKTDLSKCYIKEQARNKDAERFRQRIAKERQKMKYRERKIRKFNVFSSGFLVRYEY